MKIKIILLNLNLGVECIFNILWNKTHGTLYFIPYIVQVKDLYNLRINQSIHTLYNNCLREKHLSSYFALTIYLLIIWYQVLNARHLTTEIHPQRFFVFYFEKGLSRLLTSSWSCWCCLWTCDPPASVSRAPGITGVRCCVWHNCIFWCSVMNGVNICNIFQMTKA